MNGSTELFLMAKSDTGAVQTAEIIVPGFPDEVALQVTVRNELGHVAAVQHVAIPIKLLDAQGHPLETGLPAVKRTFVAPTPEEMAAAAGGLAELERRLEDED